ncbi:hypothetical protein [Kitasatospora sp. LaBMicrA B282]|uniref:hypothetical protein n=1 Tax=Kitasatospora sp. LaBMicrA B282 TaxID=3420949 RepID=UPI003D13D3EA
MNPHDPRKRPGAHLVHDRLGVSDPWTLYSRHPCESPLGRLAWLLATSARDLDHLHAELAAQARQVIERLEPIARGDHTSLRSDDTVLQSTSLQVDVLTARRGTAYQQLIGALDDYERTTRRARATLRRSPWPRRPKAMR